MAKPSLLQMLWLALMLSSGAQAADVAPFSGQMFEQAQRLGQPILIAVHSEWCATCKRQKPVIARIAGDDAFDSLLVLEVDFDTQKAVLRQLRAPMQSTLIAYRGRLELARSVGTSDRNAIGELMDRLKDPLK